MTSNPRTRCTTSIRTLSRPKTLPKFGSRWGVPALGKREGERRRIRGCPSASEGPARIFCRRSSSSWSFRPRHRAVQLRYRARQVGHLTERGEGRRRPIHAISGPNRKRIRATNCRRVRGQNWLLSRDFGACLSQGPSLPRAVRRSRNAKVRTCTAFDSCLKAFWG